MHAECASSEATFAADFVTPVSMRTTDGVIAVQNLHARIAGLDGDITQNGAMSPRSIELIDLLLLRGEFLGRIADYERASSLAEQRVAGDQAKGMAFLARARTRATNHRFGDALEDIAQAAELGVSPEDLVAEQVSILHQLGRGDEALKLARAATDRQADFSALGVLAVLLAERGDLEAAEAAFTACRSQYRKVSPFPLAQMDLQRGRMWLRAGEYERARAWFTSATRFVAAYAPAQAHLADIEAMTGSRASAIARLRPLAGSSDDPVHAERLAAMLRHTGDLGEALLWQSRAAEGFSELLARGAAGYTHYTGARWSDAGVGQGLERSP